MNFHTTSEELNLILRIGDRGEEAYKQAGERHRAKMALVMDVTACHANGCRLRLRDFLEADDLNFYHDLLGIRRHINRETGKLEGVFLPRFAAPEGTP
jgi:hypothetical protein